MSDIKVYNGMPINRAQSVNFKSAEAQLCSSVSDFTQSLLQRKITNGMVIAKNISNLLKTKEDATAILETVVKSLDQNRALPPHSTNDGKQAVHIAAQALTHVTSTTDGFGQYLTGQQKDLLIDAFVGIVDKTK